MDPIENKRFLHTEENTVIRKELMKEKEEFTIKKLISLTLALILALTAFSAAFAEATASPGKVKDFEKALSVSQSTVQEKSPEQAEEAAYTLDKVVVLSRHNIRFPLSGSGSLLQRRTANPMPGCAWSTRAPNSCR